MLCSSKLHNSVGVLSGGLSDAAVPSIARLRGTYIRNPVRAPNLNAAAPGFTGEKKAIRDTRASATAPSGGESQQQNRASEVVTVNTVAYQGVPGAYSEVAARKGCPNYETMPCEQFEVAFQALSQWMAERAVLPIENSLGGSIHAVYDLLIRYNLHIVGETSLAINHCLVALPGTKIGDIKRVMSHPQALAQCDGYLRKLGVVKEVADDTAGAAQIVASKKLVGVGAVCARRAAELYGLDILEEGIQDQHDNITRFIVLSRDPHYNQNTNRPYKTSVVFSLQQGSGMLFHALSVFAFRNIDLTKIESRPQKNTPLIFKASESVEDLDRLASGQRFNYLFYVDFVGNTAEVNIQNALRHLKEITTFMRILGTYPMDCDLGAISSDKFD